jgi:surfeit locus 1 family protein
VLRQADSARYLPVLATGRFDYDHELVYVARSRAGSPGVYLLTPLHTPGSDSAVLVLRGWVYSPDSRTVDLARWREADSVTVSGYVDEVGVGAAPVSLPGDPRAVRHLVLDSIRPRLPYPVRSQLVVQTSDSAQRPDRPARLTLPALDNGPHLSYAVQWFAFATIAWVGVAAVVSRERGRRPLTEKPSVRHRKDG